MQSAVETIYRQWIWIGVPVMSMALAALVLLILRVVATLKKAHLLRVPLAERQEVQFAAAERVVLSIEGPRFSTRFARVNFQLTGVNGDAVEGRRTWFRARTSGISTARMELMLYELPGPGRYVLHMTGLGGVTQDDARHAVVFMRPHLRQTMVCTLGIVLVSVVFIVSLVFFLLRLFEVQID